MTRWLSILALTLACHAEIIDRVAVIVGNSVITESQILREIRLTAFLNGEPLDFGIESKRVTANRLVEQRLIQIENEASLYPAPPPEALDDALKQALERFPNAERYREELKRAGITEEELKGHLLRQLVTLRFLDLRFRPGIQIGEEEIETYFQQKIGPELKKANPNGDFSVIEYRDRIEQALVAERVDKASDAWLKAVREHTRIEYRGGVLLATPPAQEADR